MVGRFGALSETWQILNDLSCCLLYPSLSQLCVHRMDLGEQRNKSDGHPIVTKQSESP